MIRSESQNQKWVISQVWRHILFLNYRVDPSAIRGNLPSGLELDIYEGAAYLSVVPFRMEGIRFPWSPTLPFSSLWELNLRTYVKVGEHRGIYFFTLDTDHLLGEWVARNFFHLPYRFRSMRASLKGMDYHFDGGEACTLKAKTTQVPLVTGPYHDWLVERYSLFTQKGDQLWRGDVVHRPWPLRYAKLEHLKEGLCQEFFPEARAELESVFYAEELPVFFRPFQRLRHVAT